MSNTASTRITGTLKTGAFGNFNGWVRVTPDAPILNNHVIADLVVLGIGEKTPIVNGVLDFQVVPSPDVTYKIEIGTDVQVTPAQAQVLNADGTIQTPASPATFKEAVYLDWHCLVPFKERVTIDRLLPVQIQTGHLDQSFIRVLKIIKSSPEFRGMLIDLFKPMGNWNNSYSYSRFDIVLFGGNSYLCTSSIPSGGNIAPAQDVAHWMLILSNGGLDSNGI
jgi:hypothetical protein